MSINRRGRNNSRSQHIVVHANDVLNGRGVKIAQHPGNLRFRSLVKEMQDDRYCESFSSSEKKALAREIINHIKVKLNPQGRFLKKHGQDGPWVELSKAEVEKKTKQALRDCNRSDRSGYAKQVTAPQDVERADHARRMSGLSLQEHARRQVDEESRRTKTKGGNNNRKTPPTSGAASRSSRRSNHKGSIPPVTADTFSNVLISNHRTEESIELPFPQPLDPVPAPSSTTVWAAAPVPVSATPAPRPFNHAPPVTQTPGSPLYQETNGHSQPHLSHQGSQPAINPYPSLAYHDHFNDRDNFPDHPPPAPLASNPIARFPSPVVRSPIVTESTQNNTRVFEGQHDAFLNEWSAEHHPQNLFAGEDPLDSLAERASASIPANITANINDRNDVDFILAFGNNNDVADVPDSNDLSI